MNKHVLTRTVVLTVFGKYHNPYTQPIMCMHLNNNGSQRFHVESIRWIFVNLLKGIMDLKYGRIE